MREIVSRCTTAMPAPDASQRAAAALLRGSRKAHDRFMAEWPCLSQIELLQPPEAPAPAALTVTAWNLERCKRVEEAAERLAHAGADIVLATEMDRGMARSGQRHTTRDLAQALGLGYAFGVEFVELGHGTPRETEEHRDATNDHGLHGNAILSRWPLKRVALLPLDDGGEWYVRAPKGDGQARVGGRMALAAQIDTAAGPLTLVSVHFESASDPDGRAAQTARMLDGIDTFHGPGRCVIGGDLNTAAFRAEGATGGRMLDKAAEVEPAFAHLSAAGFSWRTANTGAPTTRPRPWDPPERALTTLDWLLVRGARAEAPFVVAAESPAGCCLSDHEMIGARIVP